MLSALSVSSVVFELVLVAAERRVAAGGFHGSCVGAGSLLFRQSRLLATFTKLQQPSQELRLESPIRGLIVRPIHTQVIGGYPAVGSIVRVLISFSMPQALGPRIMRIAERDGDRKQAL